jgi:putative hemolysin
MRHDARLAREISYASSAATRGGRVVVRALENATGRLDLIRRAQGYEREVAEGRDFWEVVCARYGVGLDVRGGALDLIPREGPLVVVANHPYGILDGLTLGRILAARRGAGFRILAHHVFRRAPELERVVLPVSFDDTPEAVALNLRTRREALAVLGGGGAIGIFPGGTVSTAARPFGPPLDPVWRTFTARLVAKGGATVVPLFFHGHNSRLFQVASHAHATLRLGMLIREFRARTGTPVAVTIGEPLPPERLAPLAADAKALMDFLRRATYDLSPEPMGHALGHEFERR